MKLLDLTLETPAENLAFDEALLDLAENGDAGEVLRFWESREYFAVVGYANKAAIEVNLAACEARGIPVHRRCSGGGTVLQGPGCLSYALVLKITSDGPLKNISSANQFIMERNRAAVETAIRQQNPESRISINGHTDLALITHHSSPRRNDAETGSRVIPKKFSGNSQRRRKHYLLFHGTFLLNFDLTLIGGLLHMPSKEPDYRGGRSHSDFLTNLNVAAESIKTALASAWNVTATVAESPTQQISALMTDKYGSREWNFKL